MGSERLFVSIFLVILVAALASNSSQAYKFPVGGKDGWVLNPCENFNYWAERHRFQVNDTLYAVFKYKKGSNSVLVVVKEDYDSCNTKTPKQSLADGDSIFKFDRSGPFFFISGNAENCQKGQKHSSGFGRQKQNPTPYGFSFPVIITASAYCLAVSG